jgi:hypothetical protein
MKKLLLLVFLISCISSFGQGDDSTKYIWYKFQYGSRMPRFWADSVMKIPAFRSAGEFKAAGRAGNIAMDTLGGGKGFQWYIDQAWRRGVDSSELADTAAAIRTTIGSGGSSFTGYAIGDTIVILSSGQSNDGGYNFGEIDTSANLKVQGWDPATDTWRTLRRNNFPMGSYTPGVKWSTGGFDADKDSATNFTFYFAKRLQERTGKFIRVILISYGANPISNWIPAASTNFARITTEIAAAGVTKVHYFLWCQGETDAGLTDSAYKNKVDTLVQQLDAQTWFGQDVPIGIISVIGIGSSLKKVRDWQLSIGSGQYDKRYFFIDGLGETGIVDNVHYTATAHFNLGNKIIQALFNPARLQNNYVGMDSAGRGTFKVNVPNIGKGIVTQDQTTKRLWLNDPPFINNGTNGTGFVLGSTDAQVSRIVANTLSDAVADNPAFSLDHYVNQTPNGRFQYMAGSSTTNGYFRWQTITSGVHSTKMTLNNAGRLSMDGTYTSGQAFRAGFFGIQPFAVNNIIFGDNVEFNGTFNRLTTGQAVFAYFTGGFAIGTAANGTGSFTPTYRALYNNDGTGGIFGTLTSVANYAGARLQSNAGSMVINESGEDVDFRVEGDNDVNLIVSDAGTDKVSIGTATQTAKFGILSTAEQFRAQYDALNYFQLTTASTGSTTLNLVGTTPVLTISDSLTLTAIAQNAVDTVDWKPLVIDAVGHVKKMSWAFAGGGSVAGSNTQVIFNDAGAYGGDAGLVYDKTTDVLTAGGVTAGDLTPNTFVIATTGGRLTNSTLTTTTLTSFVSSNPSSSATVANLDDLTVVTNSLNYERNGSLVTFSVQFNVDPTLAATQTTFRFMLSVSSAFAASTNATGIGTCGTVAGLSASVTADATNDVMEVNFISVGTASFLMTITGQYRVI